MRSIPGDFPRIRWRRNDVSQFLAGAVLLAVLGFGFRIDNVVLGGGFLFVTVFLAVVARFYPFLRGTWAGGVVAGIALVGMEFFSVSYYWYTALLAALLLLAPFTFYVTSRVFALGLRWRS